VIKKPPASVGDVRDTGSVPGLGRSPGGGHGNPLQYKKKKKKDLLQNYRTQYKLAKR